MVHFFWPIMTEMPFSLPLTKVGIHFGHVRMCATPYPISWMIIGTKLYRQIIGIPMGTNCALLVADLFLHCYERDFMDSLNMIIKLMLSRLLIRLLSTSMTF